MRLERLSEKNTMYPDIDVMKTGINLKERIRSAGYSVKEIQQYLHLSCPQPVYRWFKGKALPSVDHFYALSRLLNVHMEELIVPKQHMNSYAAEWSVRRDSMVRLYCYYERIEKIA